MKTPKHFWNFSLNYQLNFVLKTNGLLAGTLPVKARNYLAKQFFKLLPLTTLNYNPVKYNAEIFELLHIL